MYQAVIGIEIHAELKTDSKMFSGSSNAYGLEANTALNEIDLAYPGSMPQVNKKAVNYGLKIARALNCTIDPVLRFDRKNYFYSDLPKGYQITQEFYPIGKDGKMTFFVDEKETSVRINRLHLEEDTAKQQHLDEKTLIDFNRAGTPLVEIVTEADFRNGKEAAAYVDAIRLLLVYLGVSDGIMAQGSLRCDVNISLREDENHEFGTKVEIKNLNSISNVEKSIEYEIQRQSEILKNNEEVISETRRFDERQNKTILMRSKDGVVDYRYIVDPNIPPTRIPDELLNEELAETPFNRHHRLMNDYNLKHDEARIVIMYKDVSDYFLNLMEKTDNTRLVLNWITQELLAVYDQKGDRDLAEWIKPEYFIDFIKAVEAKEISTRQAKEVFEEMLEGKAPKKIIKDKGMVVVSDEATIRNWIETILEENPRAIEDHKKGLPSAVKFVTGQVMRVSRGQANPQFTNILVKELLDKHL